MVQYICVHIICEQYRFLKKWVYICSIQLRVLLSSWVEQNNERYPLSFSAGSSKIDPGFYF